MLRAVVENDESNNALGGGFLFSNVVENARTAVQQETNDNVLIKLPPSIIVLRITATRDYAREWW
jgi:hypothetical protein